MRKKALLLSVFLALSLLVGCAREVETPQYINPIEFYYCLRQSAKEGRVQALSSQTYDLVDADRTITDVVEVYLRGPNGNQLVSPFPQGTACEDAWMEDDGILVVRLSDAYAQLSGVRLTLTNACLTLTLTQFDFVDAVRIETAPGMLSSQNQTPFRASDFLLWDASAPHSEKDAE